MVQGVISMKLDMKYLLDVLPWKEIEIKERLQLLKLSDAEIKTYAEALDTSEMSIVAKILKDSKDEGIDGKKLCRDWIKYYDKQIINAGNVFKVEDKWVLTKLTDFGTELEERILVGVFSDLERPLGIVLKMMEDTGYQLKIAKYDNDVLVNFTNKFNLAYEFEKVSVLVD